MEQISIFDMLKIGVGPSSSHTLGPWRAALQFILFSKEQAFFESITSIQIKLYGSLSYTGKGHATDLACLLGLIGEDPVTINTTSIDSKIETIKRSNLIELDGVKSIAFNFENDIFFEKDFLPFHPNGMEFIALLENGEQVIQKYYSIGGGFIRQEESNVLMTEGDKRNFPFPSSTGVALLKHCSNEGLSIYDIVYKNENSLRSAEGIDESIEAIWNVMLNSMYDGCHTEGTLPGSLKVKRRAFDIHKKLIKRFPYKDPISWKETISKTQPKFHEVFKWISCFALSVNEVNAALGRIVTAPTNGSAGVIPAVLMYYSCFVNRFAGIEEIKKFLLIAGEIGTLFKKGATISAAMGGCQAEIGVSSAMAAGALTFLLGGSNEQVLNAAEIAMEHHLGLTCDPINGLVQIPCIERNSMGAIKAINAAELAIETKPEDVKVPFDEVVKSMLETAKDMNLKYKETSQGGLAVTVTIPEC